MKAELNEVEARVLGCLVEKSLATPEQYPLSLNSLVAACNQKTSREPVMSLDEAAVGQGLHSLLEKRLAGRLHEPGARVPKFMHHIEMLLSGGNDKAVATICVLLLRGPQTPGELKTRTDRLCKFESTAEVESLLQDMSSREEPWVAKLPRQPGQKEQRYRHLFSSGAPATATVPTPATPASPATVSPAPTSPGMKVAPPAPGSASSDDRLARLERRVEELEALVAKLGGAAAPDGR